MMVDLLSSHSTYTVSLISAEGAVAASRTAAQRTPISTPRGRAVLLPYVSATSRTLYYLDGDKTVDSWRFDGSGGAATQLDITSGMEASFAVSPDDKQIAVSVLDFNRTPVHVTVYTDALGGGAKRVIYESDSNYVWPVAWHQGLLVLAHAFGPFEEDIGRAAPARDNPYSAISFHLVDPANADRKVLMGTCTVSGALSPAGSGCIQGGSIDWTGVTTPWGANNWGSISAPAALSPDGEWIAANNPTDLSQMGIWRKADGLMANATTSPGTPDWAGWIDGQTVIVGSSTDPNWQPVVDPVITGGYVHVVPNVHGFFAAVIPTNIA